MLPKRLVPAFLLIASAASAQPGPDPVLPSVVTLDKALDVFRSHGFDLLIAEAAVMSAEGDVKAAGAIPNLNYNVGYYRMFFQQNAFETGNGWYVGLGDSNAIEDALSGKRGLRIDVAKKALGAARMARVDAQRVLELQVKQQYFQMTLAQRALTFSLEIQQRMDEYLDLTQKRFKLGAINEADEARVEIDKLEADQAVDVATQNLRAARVQLAFLLGLRGLVPEFGIEPARINFAVPSTLAAATPDSLIKDALQHRPDLQAITLQRDRANAQVRLSKRMRFPDIALNLQYAQQGSTTGACLDQNGTQVGSVTFPGGTPTCAPGTTYGSAAQPPTLTLGITGTLPLFYQQQGEIKKAEADVRSQTAQQAKTEAQVAADVQSAFVNFASTRQLVQRMESRLLERAQTTLDKVMLQRSQGNASGLEVSAARRQFVATSIEYLQDLANYWISVAQLESAVGMELMK
jgi:cobalt-zinc-cadmium efflux system outer membrane protein